MWLQVAKILRVRSESELFRNRAEHADTCSHGWQSSSYGSASVWRWLSTDFQFSSEDSQAMQSVLPSKPGFFFFFLSIIFYKLFLSFSSCFHHAYTKTQKTGHTRENLPVSGSGLLSEVWSLSYKGWNTAIFLGATDTTSNKALPSWILSAKRKKKKRERGKKKGFSLTF